MKARANLVKPNPLFASTAVRAVALGVVAATAVVFATVATVSFAGPAVLIVIVALIAIVASVSKPEVGFFIAITIGSANGLLRRLAGWIDPGGVATQLVAVIPAILLSSVLVTSLVVRTSEPRAKTPVPLIAVTLVIVLGGVNPGGAGLVNNLLSSSLLLTGVLVFLLSYRGLLGRTHVVTAIAVIGMTNALYMLAQEMYGLTPWDAYWVERYGYAALYIGPGIVRPLGIGASAAESAALCSMLVGLSIAMMWTKKNVLWLCPAMVGLAAVLTSGTRTYALPALAVLFLGLSIGRKRPLLIAVLTLAIALPVMSYLSSRLLSASDSAGVSRVFAMVSGNEDAATSTVGIHQDLILDSLLKGIGSVIGTGTGQVSVLASGGLGSSEQDISNLALIGGIFGVLALVFLYVEFARRVPNGFRVAETTPFLFVALSTIGQWMNVGYYGATPLIWASIGYLFSIGKECDEMDRGRQRVPERSVRWTQPIC